MKIDRCIKDFMEKYDQEAMKSLEDLSTEIGMTNYKIHVFNINEAFDTFKQSLEIYKGWSNKSLTGSNNVTFEQICENAHSVIDKAVFTECDIEYRELPSFVKSYLEGVQLLSDKIDEIRSDMMLEDASNDEIIKLEEFCDHFIESLNSKFLPIVENAVKGSGYYTRKNLHTPGKKAPVFL